MWIIKQIFDGDFGCEELAPGEKPKVSVTLENEDGQTKMVSVEDQWLTEIGLDVGSVWPVDE
ncbi:hypothetical protein [Butyrivibrio sp. MC2021]|uniref:hypothetical protein n=1 Tax=Butyrivibrio sp. MC2021 TaxID=1408306 RepID=UPI00047BAE80|nr:hypothetical protein [Butyrivibrio sp. MC2021]